MEKSNSDKKYKDPAGIPGGNGSSQDDEYKTLVRQADKSYKRYVRKYKGYELTQRLRSFLYSKGFPNELIKRYIDERDAE